MNSFIAEYQQEPVLKADLTVVQKPVSISVTCPHCQHQHDQSYGVFVTDFGRPCEWAYQKIECPRCHKLYQIRDIEWD